MALLLCLAFWGVIFGLGFKVASKKTTNPVGQIFLGILLGLLFTAGIVAVLVGVAFAGCAVIMNMNHS
jgi:hypothetical protein